MSTRSIGLPSNQAKENLLLALTFVDADTPNEDLFAMHGAMRTVARDRDVALLELLYAAERMLELATDPEITDPNVRAPVTETPDEGVGSVEAPRGTLTHHYWTDERGILTKVNLIVGTTNNYAPISMSIKKAAQAVIWYITW